MATTSIVGSKVAKHHAVAELLQTLSMQRKLKRYAVHQCRFHSGVSPVPFGATMPQLGRFIYPGRSLNDSLALASRIAREFGGNLSRDGLARALGMSPRGGHFSMVLGALRAWGLVEGRSHIRVTQLGLRAISPVSPAEAAASRETLVRSVELFQEIARRMPGRVPDAPQLQLLLEEVTEAPRLTVEEHMSLIGKVYGEAASALTAPSGNDGDRQATARAHSDSPRKGRGDRLEAGRIEVNYSGGTISLPETPENLDAVIAVLQSYRKTLETEMQGPSSV